MGGGGGGGGGGGVGKWSFDCQPFVCTVECYE